MFSGKFRNKNFRNREKLDAFSREKTFPTEERLEGKHNFLFIFSTTHSHGDNLQGFIAQETKERGDLGTATQILKETKKMDRKNYRESRIFCNVASKNFREF